MVLACTDTGARTPNIGETNSGKTLFMEEDHKKKTINNWYCVFKLDFFLKNSNVGEIFRINL